MTIPRSPTPAWAEEKIRLLLENNDEPEVLEAVLELLAAIAPTKEQDKFKYEAAWAAIDLGYCKTEDCRTSSRRHFSAA